LEGARKSQHGFCAGDDVRLTKTSKEELRLNGNEADE